MDPHRRAIRRRGETAPSARPLVLLLLMNAGQVKDLWQPAGRRSASPHVDHQLAQIARDGPQNLAERGFPLMVANLAAGAPIEGLARIVRAWLAITQRSVEAAFADSTPLPDSLRGSVAARTAIDSAAP